MNLTNWNTHIVQYLQFTLQALQPLAVAPATGFTAAGPVGGPFNITSQNFSVTNVGTIPLNWSLISTSAWLTATGGGVLAAGAAGTATVSLSAAANSLAAGTYAANVWFTNQTSGGALVLQFNLLVGQPLVQNGGFETGDFTGWTLNGDGSPYDFVTSSGGTGITPHSGSYFAALGELGKLAYLSQNVPTAAGQTYLLSLWLDSAAYRGNTTPNGFLVQWNGITVTNLTNVGAFSWKNLQFIVSATGSSTVLQFGFQDDPSYLGLDDVTVTPVYPPSISTQPANQTILSGSNVTFIVTAGGTSPLAYQWRKNGTNISNGGSISGAKTNALTITAATTNNAGNYSVVITNNYGSITSAVATLTVTPASGPSISAQPANQTVFAGGNAAFNVTAAGTPPLVYQWRKNGANIFNGGVISGATTNVLTFTAAATNNTGNYSVVITNNYGSITSAVATLTVNLQRPIIALASSDNPGGFKDSLNFTAGLTPSGATGSVQFFTNGFYFDSESLVAGSAASVFTAALPRGTNQITAIYSGDANDLPATNSLAQIVTNHPPMATNFVTKRFAGLTLDISVTNLSSNWSDVDGDIVSLAAIGVSTNGVTVTNNAGTLIYWNTNNVDDKFVCTITDGWGGTNFQNVYLTVVPLPNNAIPAIGSMVVSGGKTISLNLDGASGFTYVLESTTNLGLPGSWQPVVTNAVGSSGVWQFSGAITNTPHRFYRLKLAQ
jgi:hypothetical protein